MADAGLEWNVKKCKVLNVKRGVVNTSEGDLVLVDGSKVKSLESEDVYKFLGILENELHDTAKLVDNIKTTIVKIANVVWSSPLSDANKVHATNTFVFVSRVLYVVRKIQVNRLERNRYERAESHELTECEV